MADELRRAFDSLWMASRRRNTIPGRLGKPNGDGTFTVKIAERPGWDYVRLGPEGQQGVTVALNLGVPHRANLPVEMMRSSDLGPLVILGVDGSGGRLEQFGSGSGNTYSTAPHTHELGSGLEYEIEALRIEPGRVRPVSGLRVYINPFRYHNNTDWETWSGGIIDLTSYKPSGAGNWAWVLVGIDPSGNSATAVKGTEYSVTSPLTIDLLDDIAFTDYIPCAGIRIKESDTTLTDLTRYEDAHGWFSPGGSAGATAPLDLTVEDAATAAVTTAATLGHDSTGTPAAGFGPGLDFEAETTTTPGTFIGSIEFDWTVAAHATRASQLKLYAGQNDAGSGKQLIVVIRAPDTMVGWQEGNARGEGSIDIQTFRNNAAEVASGDYATIIGGFENTCSGNFGAGILAGQQNTVSQDGSAAVGGVSNTVSGYNSAALAGGNANITSDTTYGIGNEIWSAGAAQHRTTIHAIARASHADTTWYTITSEYGGTLDVPVNGIWQFEVEVVGTSAGAGSIFAYYVRGVFENDGGVYTITIGPDGYKTIIEDDAAFEMQVTNSGATMLVQIRRNGGADPGAARWVAMVRTLEVISA